MATIPAAVRAFLASGPFAHIVTLDPDGTPHVSLAWAGVAPEGDEIIWASFFDQHKLDNLRRDPRIVLSFEATEFDGEGLHPYLVIEGRARVSEGGALEVMDHLAQWYIGPGAMYGWRDSPDGLVIRVAVDRIYGTGPWKEAAAAEGAEGAEDASTAAEAPATDPAVAEKG